MLGPGLFRRCHGDLPHDGIRQPASRRQAKEQARTQAKAAYRAALKVAPSSSSAPAPCDAPTTTCRRSTSSACRRRAARSTTTWRGTHRSWSPRTPRRPGSAHPAWAAPASPRRTDGAAVLEALSSRQGFRRNRQVGAGWRRRRVDATMYNWCARLLCLSREHLPGQLSYWRFSLHTRAAC